MVNVELDSVSVEFEKNRKRSLELLFRAKPWVVSVAMKLRDVETNKTLSDWYYLMVCSPEYPNAPSKNSPSFDKRYFLIQSKLDIDRIENEARRRLRIIRAANWDDFRRQMTQHFLPEE